MSKAAKEIIDAYTLKTQTSDILYFSIDRVSELKIIVWQTVKERAKEVNICWNRRKTLSKHVWIWNLNMFSIVSADFFNLNKCISFFSESQPQFKNSIAWLVG